MGYGNKVRLPAVAHSQMCDLCGHPLLLSTTSPVGLYPRLMGLAIALKRYEDFPTVRPPSVSSLYMAGALSQANLSP